MKAVITVIGKDTIGIIAEVTTVLARNDINVLDMSQTILQDYFTMIMIVDLKKSKVTVKELKDDLDKAGEKVGVKIKIQHEDIFNAMHTI